MNKVLALIVAAAVFMMVAVSIIAMTSGSLIDFDNSLDEAGNSQVCETQIERAEQNGQWSRVSPDCIEHVPEDNTNQFFAAKYEDDLVEE